MQVIYEPSVKEKLDEALKTAATAGKRIQEVRLSEEEWWQIVRGGIRGDQWEFSGGTNPHTERPRITYKGVLLRCPR